MMNCKNLVHKMNSAWHSSPGFLREMVEKQEFPPSPVSFFLKQSKTLSLEFESQYTILNEEQREGWAFHTETNCGHCCCNKNFQILITFDFH